MLTAPTGFIRNAAVPLGEPYGTPYAQGPASTMTAASLLARPAMDSCGKAASQAATCAAMPAAGGPLDGELLLPPQEAMNSASAMAASAAARRKLLDVIGGHPGRQCIAQVGAAVKGAHAPARFDDQRTLVHDEVPQSAALAVGRRGVRIKMNAQQLAQVGQVGPAPGHPEHLAARRRVFAQDRAIGRAQL